nr:hypothetical protein HK105_002710 [Polyrhizophydium stewartii]
MRLHCEPSLERPLPSAFMQEYRRRIWWALYETDRHLAIVSKLPFSIRDSDFRVNYQCSESLWIKFGHGDMYEIAAQMAAAAAQGGHGDAMAIDGPGGAGGHRPVSPGSAYEVHLSPLYMQLLSITSRIVVFERSLMNRQATVYHGGAAAYGASRLGNSSFATTALTSLGPATHLTAETVTPGGVGIGAGALSPPGARTRGGGGGGAGHTERRRGAAAVAAAQAIADSGLDEASRRQMAELEGALNEWFRRAPQWLQTIAPTYSPGLGECASGLPPWKSAFVQIMYHYSRILLHVHSMQWAIGCARGAAAAAATPTQALSAVALDTSYTASVTSAYTISTLVKRFLAHNPDFLYVSPFVSNCMYRAGTVLLQSVQVEPQHEERASRAINAIVHGLSGLSRSSTAAMQDLGSLTDQRQALLRE